MKLTESHKDILKLGLLGGLFFIPFLGGVHLFDWDEINFAEVSREMMELGEYLQIHINYLPFWEKPPFFFWLQVAAMKVFGVGEFAARLPNAICGILSLIVLYLMGRQLYNRRFGLLWALVYLGSTLPHLYFRSGIIDPWFNLFIFGGLYLFLLFYWKKEQFEGIQLSRGSWTYLFAAGFVLGMGMLTKGPVAYLIVALCLFVYWIKERLRLYISPLQFLFFTLSASLVTLSWYGLETLRHGPSFIYEFNLYQYRLFSTPDAGHKGFFGYHFVVLLIGCFPASVFALRSMYAMPEASHRFQQNFRQWMLILFWVVLLLFSVVQSKIVHYSSLCYFPLTYLASLYLKELWEGRLSFPNWMKWSLLGIGGMFVTALLLLPYLGNNVHLLTPLFNDPFALANLEAAVDWGVGPLMAGSWLAVVLVGGLAWLRAGQIRNGIVLLFLGNALFVTLTLWTCVGNFEAYSQRAAIEFFEEKATEDCYIQAWGYKTYGHLFYARKVPVTDERSHDIDWLLQAKVDKPTYFISKVHRCEALEKHPKLKEIGRKNGFVFFQRIP